jgi:hypothetical protein
MVENVWPNGYWYKVDYEGLHIIYSSCGRYGHHAKTCTHIPVPLPVETRVQKKKHLSWCFLNCKGLSTLCISYNSFIAYQKNAIAKEVEHISTNGPLLKKETM